MEYIAEEYKDVLLGEPSADYSDERLNSITYAVIGAAMEVYNNLGRGFLESVYKDCLVIELQKRGINFQKEKKYTINYKGITIPHHYIADFIIEDSVILEVKAQTLVIEENYRQIINYLAVSNCKVGLLINFGENTLKYKRVILTK